uniref:Disintegrin and metalloproteinase domain-containing protein 10 n=1 Tax=Takifugu rubripes TaxID=31033 RepID=A0A674NA71_TAKRU
MHVGVAPCILPHMAAGSFLCSFDTGHYRNPLNKYILHYEGLSYDTELVHSKHQRAKRALAHEDKFLHLEFHAHGRHFNLRMKRDTQLFAEDLKVEVSGEEIPYDTSHIYTGELYGEKGTLSHGAIVDGKFEGFIQSYHGNYYVEPAERYLDGKNVPFHSVIYHEDDIRKCGRQQHRYFLYVGPPVLLRKRRMTQPEKNTCQLFIQTDHLFYKYYKTREAVIAQISSHVKAIDAIYQGTQFKDIRNISFMVKRIRINTTSDERDRSNPFRFANIGVEKFLELNSEQNHDDYCLAYVFTDRDFDDGVLGLAWVGAPSGSSGGICEKSKLYSDGKKKSLNTGIITVQNYASHVPPKVSHITFAHEVGHNFGSPHDSGPECTPGESKSQDMKEKGNYIMYARATSGDKLNNNKFSVCSVNNITNVLQKKRNNCFVESGQPICGNGLVEPGEECDCGYSDQCRDQCCYDANQPDNKKCKLKPNKVCSPSQGPCCTFECSYKGRNEKCREESECAHQGMCNGVSAQCPTSEPKANFTACHGETQVCLNGGCSGSICEKYGLEACTCASQDGKDETELCHVCCMEKSESRHPVLMGMFLEGSLDHGGMLSSPRSESQHVQQHQIRTSGSLLQQEGDHAARGLAVQRIQGLLRRVHEVPPGGRGRTAGQAEEGHLQPRALREHRRVDRGTCLERDHGRSACIPVTPGGRFQDPFSLFSPLQAHWWAVLLMGIALIMLMAGFIKICSVHTPSSNPKLPPPKPLPGEICQETSHLSVFF